MVSLDLSGFTRTHQGNGQSSEMLPRAPSPFSPPECDQPWRDSPSHPRDRRDCKLLPEAEYASQLDKKPQLLCLLGCERAHGVDPSAKP